MLEVVVALVDIDEDFPFAKDEDFFERGNVVASNGCVVLGTKSQFLYLVVGQVGNLAFPIGTAVNCWVVHQYELAVFGASHIYLNHIDTHIDAALESRNGVLGMVAPVASMCYDGDILGIAEEIVTQFIRFVLRKNAKGHNGQDDQQKRPFHGLILFFKVYFAVRNLFEGKRNVNHIIDVGFLFVEESDPTVLLQAHCGVSGTL